MQTEQQNYGVAESPAAAVGTQDEKTWSVLSHLSIFLNLVTGFLGPVASLIVWLVYKDRSQKVAFQALQSTIYQGAWLVILAAGWAVTGLLTFVPDRLSPDTGHGGYLRVPLPAQRLRSLQSEPGRRLPVSDHRGPDREPLTEPSDVEVPVFSAGTFSTLEYTNRIRTGGFVLNYPLDLRFKIATIGTRVSVTDVTGRLVAYVRKKKFRLKEDVGVYADENQRKLLFRIKADRVFRLRCELLRG